MNNSNEKIVEDKVEESENFKKTTPNLNKAKFKTLEKDFNTSAKKSRIEVNLAFESLKKQHSKRTVLSKNQGSIKSFNSLQLLDKAIHSDEDKVEKKRSTTNLGTKAQVPDTNLIEHVDNLNHEEAKEEGKSLHENQEDKKSIQSFGPIEGNLDSQHKQPDIPQQEPLSEHKELIEAKRILKEHDHHTTDGDSNYENKILIQYKDNEELDDELKVINKIYDRFYVNQKLPNKRKNKQFRTKYYKFIPRNPLMKQETEYIRDKSGKKVKDQNLTAEEKRMRKIMDQKYKERDAALKENYIKMLNEKIRGETEKPILDEFSKNLANPAFKYLGLIYNSPESGLNFNNQMVASPSKELNQFIDSLDVQNLNNTQIITPQNDYISNENQKFEKQRGISHDLGSLPSTKYASMNYNRFQYLYNFKNDTKDVNKSQNIISQPNIISNMPIKNNQVANNIMSPNNLSGITVDQIVNNPCIFKIRERLMSNKLPDVYQVPSGLSKISNNQTKDSKIVQHSAQYPIEKTTCKNPLMNRNCHIPKKMDEKDKNKYYKILIGQEEFLPKIILPKQYSSKNEEVGQETNDSISSRENMRKNKKGINRRLNYSVACKIYMGSNDIMFK